mmetsp:Transcript_12527/g.24258  ORF Transcript_12527/g.24258 Transcript_12527/m.24258 type:complete len:310 (-) Transcript_12527:128-1057(-)
MQTQFNMLLGNLPRGYADDPLLIIFITLSIVVQFFLMLNFLLAIVVEGYTKVRQDIDDNQVEKEFFYDVLLSLHGMLCGLIYRWPSKQEWVSILQEELQDKGRIISFEDIWEHYLWLEMQEGEGLDQVASPLQGTHVAGQEKENVCDEKRALRKKMRARYAHMYAHYRRYEDIKCKPMFMALNNNVMTKFLHWRIDKLWKPRAQSAVKADQDPTAKPTAASNLSSGKPSPSAGKNGQHAEQIGTVVAQNDVQSVLDMLSKISSRLDEMDKKIDQVGSNPGSHAGGTGAAVEESARPASARTLGDITWTA